MISTTQEQTAKRTKMTTEDDSIPIGRGWAWLIVVGCFFCFLFMVGTIKSLGIFLTHFKDQFDVSTSLAAMVMGGSAIVQAILAPVCIMMGQLFTVRKVIMIGGFIGFLGMSISCLLISMEYVILTFGICFGIGNATVYGNCLVLLSLYFKKRRSLANGLAQSGSSIGQFVLPPFIEHLLSTYGLSGCLLLMGGVYFHIVAAACLFRPLTYWDKNRTRQAVKEEEEAENSQPPSPHTLTNGKLVANEDPSNGAAAGSPFKKNLGMIWHEKAKESGQSEADSPCSPTVPTDCSVIVCQMPNSDSVPAESGASVCRVQRSASVGSAQSGVSVGLAQSGVSVYSAQSGVSVGSAQSGVSVYSAQSGVSVGSAQSGDSVGLAQSGVSVGSAQSGDSVGSAQSGDSVGSAQSSVSVGSAQSGVSVGLWQIIVSNGLDSNVGGDQGNPGAGFNRCQSANSPFSSPPKPVSMPGDSAQDHPGDAVEDPRMPLMDGGMKRGVHLPRGSVEGTAGSSLEGRSVSPIQSVPSGAPHRLSTVSLGFQSFGSALGTEELQQTLDEEEEVKEEGARGFCHDLLTIFNFSIMRSYVAVLVTLTNLLTFFGYFNFVIFLPATVMTRGIDSYDKAILVSITGIGDLAGRLTMAAVADRSFIARYKLQALCIFLVGVNILALIWADTYVWMTVHCALYGFFGGIQVSLVAVTMIDFVGMQRMPQMLAVTILIQGLGVSIGQPLLGGVHDVTGSFEAVLVITGLCCIAGSLVLLCYPLALKLEYRRPERYRLVPPQRDSI